MYINKTIFTSYDLCLFLNPSCPSYSVDYMFLRFFPPGTSILTLLVAFHPHWHSNLGYWRSVFTPPFLLKFCSCLFSVILLSLLSHSSSKIVHFPLLVSSIWGVLFVLNRMGRNLIEITYICRFRIYDFNRKYLTCISYEF